MMENRPMVYVQSVEHRAQDKLDSALLGVAVLELMGAMLRLRAKPKIYVSK
jgi:hypothetical protein